MHKHIRSDSYRSQMNKPSVVTMACIVVVIITFIRQACVACTDARVHTYSYPYFNHPKHMARIL